jgi:hypothetical protein
MTDNIQKLSKVFDEIVQLLEASGEKYWANWMLEAKDGLKYSNDYGIEHILAAYGGMGSFTDLVLYQKVENGRIKWTVFDRIRNSRLSKLRTRAWELANAIRRESTRKG